MALFPEALPQAQSRTREWQDVQQEAAATNPDLPDGSSRWQTYTMVAGFVAAVACVHGTIAVLLTASATGDYKSMGWIASTWIAAMMAAYSSNRLFRSSATGDQRSRPDNLQ